MSAIGNNGLEKVYFGDTEISKMYLGSTLVYENEIILPYDAEIEYIGSNSSASGIYQYIDTGITPQLTYQVHIRVSPLTTYPTSQSSLFLTSWSGRRFFIQTNSSGPNKIYWHGMNPSQYISLNSSGVNDIVCGNGFITVNGVTYSNSNYLQNTSDTIKLFNNSNNRRAVFDLYLFEITNNGSTVACFKPVRVGTEGCLYEIKSKQLFHNAGTGSFTLGNDVTT